MVKESKDCLARFTQAQNDNHDYRELSREDDHFCLDKDGMWQDNVVRNMGSRPRFTFDKTNPLIEDIMAEVEGMDFGARVRPTGGGATKELAETYSGLIRYIENLSDVPTILRNVTRRQIRRGVDFIRLKTDWSGEEGFEQDIYVKQIPDSINRVWLGYHEEQDGSDAEEGWQVHAMPPEEFEDKFGRKCSSIGIDDDNNIHTYDYKPELALYLEYMYKKPYNKTVAQMSDGSQIEITKESEKALDELAAAGITEVRRRTFKSFKVYSRLLDAEDWLEKERETVWCSIPLVPVYANFEIVEGKVIWSSMTRRIMDPQRVYNYARSREIEEGALAPRRKIVMSKEQAKDKTTQRQLAELNTSAEPVLFITPDPSMPNVQEIGGAVPNPHLQTIAASSSQDLAESGGVFSAQQGQNPRYQSGWAVEQMISKGDAKTTRWLNNTAIAYRRICQMLIKAIPQVYDTEREIRVLNNDGTDEAVAINREVFDQQTQQMVKVNDLSVGKYDIVIDLDRAYKSKRQETAERLVQLAAVDPSLMMEASDIVYGSLDVPGAEEIRERKRLQLLKAGAIPDTQMTDEEKQEADLLIQQQQQQAAQQAEQMAPVTEAMVANYQSIIEDRLQKMQLEQEKLMLQAQKQSAEQMQAQERLMLDKQKQVDDLLLKLTDMEQKYQAQLNAEFNQNKEVTNEMR
jgi:hypothetical protein